jgi:hypothetical protein
MNPVAYAGPIRAELTEARRVFSAQLHYASATTHVEHAFEIGLFVTWEDRLQLVAYQSGPEIVLAETESGERLRPTRPVAPDWNVLGRNTRQLAATLHLEPPPIAEKRLRRLVVKWPMMAVGDRAELVVVTPTTGDQAHQDDLVLSVESVAEDGSGRHRAKVLIGRDLVHPRPAEVLLYECDLQLEDAEGRPFERQGMRGSLVGASARLVATFRPRRVDAVPACLRLTYPRIRDVEEVTIEFGDVPLTRALPE